MIPPVRSTIAQMLVPHAQAFDFARIVAEVERLLSARPAGPVSVDWSCDDLVTFDLNDCSILLACAEFEPAGSPSADDRAADQRQPGQRQPAHRQPAHRHRRETCLTVAVGPSIAQSLRSEDHATLCSRLVEQIQSRFSPSAVLWHEVPGWVDADQVEDLLTNLPPQALDPQGFSRHAPAPPTLGAGWLAPPTLAPPTLALPTQSPTTLAAATLAPPTLSPVTLAASTSAATTPAAATLTTPTLAAPTQPPLPLATPTSLPPVHTILDAVLGRDRVNAILHGAAPGVASGVAQEGASGVASGVTPGAASGILSGVASVATTVAATDAPLGIAPGILPGVAPGISLGIPQGVAQGVGPAIAPVLPAQTSTKPLQGGLNLVTRTAAPAPAAPAAAETPTAAETPARAATPALPQHHDETLAVLRKALYPRRAGAAVRPSLQIRIAAQCFNATLIFVWAPLGLAAMAYALLRGEDIVLSSRLMALTGTVLALAHSPLGHTMRALAGI